MLRPPFLATTLLALGSFALAQSAPQPAPTGGSGAPPASGPAPTPAPAQAANPATGSPRIEDLPVNVRLGVRAELVRRGWPCIYTLVIVPDDSSYIAAIAAWSLHGRYPVLIDDGSDAAAEDIARFVRAFEPKSVVRWKSAGPAPTDPDARRAAIEHALFTQWSDMGAGPMALASQEDLLAAWSRHHFMPPGIVIADAADPAWPAALALAAGRAQPIAWTHMPPGGPNAAMTLQEFGALADDADAAAQKTGLPWRQIGDALDALTICGNAPVKVQLDAGDVVATTDLLGRLPGDKPEGKDAPKTPRQTGKRWAWCGQIFGTSEQAAYRAMCALFLAPKRAWLFDGYPDTKPWSDYDCTAAAKNLQQGAGLETIVDDSPHNSDVSWRLRADAGVDAGLVMVDSKGNGDEFNLNPGQCRPSDAPFLNVPAIVYFVHSWSAVMPAERGTVAGRWLERGAYAYLGSTYEPYLQSFVPTPAVAARLALGVPWGAAVRFDDTPPPDKPNEKVAVPPAWKLATIGDPLITLGPPPAPAAAALPLQGAASLEDELKTQLGDKNFLDGVRTLVLLGRDKDVARLAAALMHDVPKSFTPRVAAECILPLMRAHDTPTLLKAYAQLTPDLASDGVRQDALWHTCGPQVGSADNEAMVDLLRANLRPDQIGRDAAELARAVAHFYGRDASVAMLNDARSRSRTDYDKAHVDAAMKKLSAK